MDKENYYLCSEQFEELKKQELHFINQNFNRPEQEKNIPRAITGLSLSGGGIRSAIFNLGVLQALAKNGLLQKIDYLSTVSGGGYIGSSLTWFLSEQTQKNFVDDADLKQIKVKILSLGQVRTIFHMALMSPAVL